MGANDRRNTKPASITDIAKRAGVNSSTVSRALRNSPWIPHLTRERIRDIASELDYVPNALARELVQGSRTIGACLPELGDPTLAEDVLGLDQAAREYGHRLLVRLCHGGRHREVECVEWFREHRATGIFIFRSKWARDGDWYAGAGLSPVVTVAPPRPRSVRATGRQLLEGLLEMVSAGD